MEHWGNRLERLRRDKGFATQTAGGWKSSAMIGHYARAGKQSNYIRAHRAASPVDNMKGVC